MSRAVNVMERAPKAWVGEARTAAAEYRHLVALQATLPASRRYTMGGAIRAAKARAYAEAEAQAAVRS